MSTRGGDRVRLLVDLVQREDGVGAARRWRRYTAAEIAAGVRAQGVPGDLDALTGVITALLDGTSDEIPDQLLEPLAAFFRAPVTDLTDEPQVVETAILERLVVELGADGVLFCRDHLARETANKLLRAVLDALRRDARTAAGEHPP